MKSESRGLRTGGPDGISRGAGANAEEGEQGGGGDCPSPGMSLTLENWEHRCRRAGGGGPGSNEERTPFLWPSILIRRPMAETMPTCVRELTAS